MRFILIFKSYLFVLLFTSLNLQAYRQAVVALPVVDLVSQPLGLPGDTCEQVRAKYSSIPASWQDSSRECARVHQALFNELVDVVSETEFELEVHIKNAMYGTREIETLWALKEGFVCCEQLDNAAIPKPINYLDKSIPASTNIIALKMPFYDFITGKLYSAGTRFCCLGLEALHAKVLIYNFTTGVLCKTYIPLCFCHMVYPDATINTKKADFVDILQSWARVVQKNGKSAVPFVWGGVSFKAKTSLVNCKNILNRPKGSKELVYTGFDASGLILRAAQIAGLPYFYKNSTTALQNLHLQPQDYFPQDGDILGAVGKGFIVVVSDARQNKLIRAAGVSAGYGYVVENSLNELFADINTYQELVEHIATGKTIKLIGANGEHRGTLENLRIYAI